jgi:hypothetical protein
VAERHVERNHQDEPSTGDRREASSSIMDAVGTTVFFPMTVASTMTRIAVETIGTVLRGGRSS